MKFKTLAFATILGLTTSFTVSAQVTFDYKDQNIQLKKNRKRSQYMTFRHWIS